MAHYEPKEPFDGYDDLLDSEYVEMMDFIVRVESIQAKGLGEWVIDNLPLPKERESKKKRIIDVGCGPGLYLLPYKEKGWEVFGIDACSQAGKLIDPKEFQRTDLRFPFKPDKPFDIAICFEVAEHLEAHWADRLIDTLSDCAPIIIFSAAVPGQGGTFHYNEQPHEYWIKKFYERHGYMVHPITENMRQFLAKWTPERERGEVSGWLIDNSFIFIDETKFGK